MLTRRLVRFSRGTLLSIFSLTALATGLEPAHLISLIEIVLA